MKFISLSIKSKQSNILLEIASLQKENYKDQYFVIMNLIILFNILVENFLLAENQKFFAFEMLKSEYCFLKLKVVQF